MAGTAVESCRSDRWRASTPRLLAVGDAAGLVGLTTGGVFITASSAGAAAACFTRSPTMTRELRLATYEALARAAGTEIRIGPAFRTLASASTTAIDALVELARIDGLVPKRPRTSTGTADPPSPSSGTPSSQIPRLDLELKTKPLSPIR